MYIPSSKSKFSQIILLCVALILFWWVNSSRIFVKEKYFAEKLQAAKIMAKAQEIIKQYHLDHNVFIDKINDPNQTGLIGEKQTLITTDRGSLTAKLTSLNPNMAAVIVELFKDARLQAGDRVAMSCTGSFPSINIAVMSAAKTLDLDLVMITSVGASMFGATSPVFTWLDMETLLNEKEIFPYKSVAASLGGGRDLGRGLNRTGRDLILEAISRNNVDLVQTNSLEQNITEKMKILNSYGSIDLYVNVGGGLSSLGNSINGRLIGPGYHRHINIKNIPLKGTMFLFADEGDPIIHLLDIEALAEKYGLPLAPDPIPEPGSGKMFLDERYNLTITSIALAILVLLVILVIFFDHKELKIKEGDIK